MKYLYYYNTPIGKLGLAEEHGFLTNLCFINSKPPANIKLLETDFLKEAYQELLEYFEQERTSFDIPINPAGSSELQKVLMTLCSIPYGQVVSYKDIADELNLHPRAVGTFVKKNPIPIIIPCHRVIGNDGKLTGYLGGLEIKKKLLELERIDIWRYLANKEMKEKGLFI